MRMNASKVDLINGVCIHCSGDSEEGEESFTEFCQQYGINFLSGRKHTLHHNGFWQPMFARFKRNSNLQQIHRSQKTTPGERSDGRHLEYEWNQLNLDKYS